MVINDSISESLNPKIVKTKESRERKENIKQVQLAYLDQMRQTKTKELSRVLNMQLNKIQETVQDSESTHYLRSFEEQNRLESPKKNPGQAERIHPAASNTDITGLANTRPPS